MMTESPPESSSLKRSKTVHNAINKRRNMLTSASSSNAFFPSTNSLPARNKRSHGISRRYCSDTSVWQVRSTDLARGSRQNYSRKATILMAQRSNAAGVRAIVSSLDEKCDRASVTPNEILPSDDPYPYCAMLMHIADDAYYRVVLGSANCVSILVKAMTLFPQRVNLQEACCCALGKLCDGNGSNQRAVMNANGVQQIVVAMRQHSASIAVQSAACAALRQMRTMLLNEPKLRSNRQVIRDVITSLNTAKRMYITARSKAYAEELLLALETQYTSVEQLS